MSFWTTEEAQYGGIICWYSRDHDYVQMLKRKREYTECVELKAKLSWSLWTHKVPYRIVQQWARSSHWRTDGDIQGNRLYPLPIPPFEGTPTYLLWCRHAVRRVNRHVLSRTPTLIHRIDHFWQELHKPFCRGELESLSTKDLGTHCFDSLFQAT